LLGNAIYGQKDLENCITVEISPLELETLASPRCYVLSPNG